MLSIGGAVLIEVVLCIAAIAFAARRSLREIEPTLRSFDRLHREVAEAADLVSRDTGRVRAGQRILGRHP